MLARGNRKPEGGGPEGVAVRWAEEENDAVAARGQSVRTEKAECSAEETGRARESITNGVVAAMVVELKKRTRRTLLE